MQIIASLDEVTMETMTDVQAILGETASFFIRCIIIRCLFQDARIFYLHIANCNILNCIDEFPLWTSNHKPSKELYEITSIPKLQQCSRYSWVWIINFTQRFIGPMINYQFSG